MSLWTIMSKVRLEAFMWVSFIVALSRWTHHFMISSNFTCQFLLLTSFVQENLGKQAPEM